MKAKKIRKADPISAPSWYRNKQKNDLRKTIHAIQERESLFKSIFHNELIKGGAIKMAILNELQKHADEIMKLLEKEDCDENVGIHVTRNAGIIGLTMIEHTYYSRTKNEKWHKLPKTDD